MPHSTRRQTIFSATERDVLVQAYFRHAELLNRAQPLDDDAQDDVDEQAYFEIERTVQYGPPAMAWELVVELLRRVPDERLNVYASGPLEELIRLHGAALVDQIEQEAARDDRFRWALGCVWIAQGELPPIVIARLVAASGNIISPLPKRRRRRIWDG